MVGLLITYFLFFLCFLVVVWICGALFYDVGRASLLGGVLAVSCFTLALAALVFWQPPWKPVATILLLSACFLRWWFSQQPSNERAWAPGFTLVPSVSLQGDVLTIENVRNMEYQTIDDCTPRYETRNYRLSELRGVDALLLHWGSPWMCHPMFVFDFGSDGRFCISIEVRYQVGQKYSFFRSLYRQQELMFVVCDERDAILRRTKCLENHDLYLYRLDASPLAIRQFLLEYTNSINVLAAQPRWYHGLTNNCTTSIYAQGRGRMQWDWRMLFNGALDWLMYDRELLDQSLPFETLKQKSWVNDIANRAPVEGFGDYLREQLPGYRSQVPGDSERSTIQEEQTA